MNAQIELAVMQAKVEDFLDYLRKNNYSKVTVTNYRHGLHEIIKFMQKNNFYHYSNNLRTSFLMTKNKTTLENQRNYARVLDTYFSFLQGKEIPIAKKKTEEYYYPEAVQNAVCAFITFYQEQKLKESTIREKRSSISKFFKDSGCKTLDELNAQNISKACCMIENSNSFSIYRNFLKFCCKHNFTRSDYSTLIPKIKRRFRIPTTYSVTEIVKLENSFTRTSLVSKRNYAILLLLSRLGLRSGDVVNLKLNNLDFINEKITLVQEKTGNPISLPMLTEIKIALQDYLKVRPKENIPFVFLRTRAPYIKIQTSTIRIFLKKAFIKCDIDILGKRHGAHTLRASLATSMINDSISYEIVRKVLGHTDGNVIKHYAKLDIDKLRICAIPVIEATGQFKTFLEGGQ